MAKVGHAISASAVRAALRRHRAPPAPQRRKATTWRDFLRSHKAQLRACDFFTVETVFLQIHDRDATFPPDFDAVFTAEGVEIVRTPHRAPSANAYAERRVRSAREECLDHLLIASEAHLRRVLTEYVAYYNQARPHQGLEQRCPVALPPPGRVGPVRRRDRLGDLLHDYFREAA